MQRLLRRASSRVLKVIAKVAVIVAVVIEADVVAGIVAVAATTVDRVKIADLAKIVDRSRMPMAMRSMQQSRLSR
jgi:hypothetical protein